MRTSTRTVVVATCVALSLLALESLAVPSGRLVAWGSGRWIGGEMPAITNPPAGSDFVQVTGCILMNFGFALRTNGTIIGWGAESGEHEVTVVPSYSDWVRVVAGNQCAMGLRANGQLVGWGWNSWGQTQPPPGTYQSFDLGASGGVGLLTDGSVKPWGWDSDGSVSNPPAGNNFIAVAAGNRHFVALRNDGTLAAWGNNDYNQVAGAPLTNNDYIGVFSGPFTSFAIRENGQCVAWGDNGKGQAEVPAGDYINFDGGDYHGQGVRADGRVIAWGCKGYNYPYLPYNVGQLFAPTDIAYAQSAATGDGTCFALNVPAYPLGRVRKVQRVTGIGFVGNPYAFGSVNLGNTVTGTLRLLVSMVAVSNVTVTRISGSTNLTVGGLASSVAAGGAADFSVMFNSSAIGQQTARFTVDDGAGGMDPVSFYASGIGLPAPVPSVATVSGLTGGGTPENPFDFGGVEVDTVVTGLLRLSISGATASNLYLLRTSGAANFRSSGLTPVLDPGAYDDFRVVYLAPSDAGDAQTAVIELSADAPMQPMNLHVRATPVPEPALLLLPLVAWGAVRGRRFSVFGFQVSV